LNGIDDARIADLKRRGVQVYQKTIHDEWGWWWRKEGERLNGPFPSAAAACKDAFAQIG